MCNIISLALVCHWCRCKCYIIFAVSSMAPFHLLGQDDEKVMQHDISGHVMWCDWHWHHVVPMASSMTPLHLFSKYNQNEVQHIFQVMQFHWSWCQCQMMLTILSIAPFHFLVKMIKMWCNVTFLVMWCDCLQHHVIPMALSMAPLYFFSQNNQN